MKNEGIQVVNSPCHSAIDMGRGAAVNLAKVPSSVGPPEYSFDGIKTLSADHKYPIQDMLTVSLSNKSKPVETKRTGNSQQKVSMSAQMKPSDSANQSSYNNTHVSYSQQPVTSHSEEHQEDDFFDESKSLPPSRHNCKLWCQVMLFFKNKY